MIVATKYHNAPESAGLTEAKRATIEFGAEAIAALRKTFDHWMAIAHGVAILKSEADRIGGKFTFYELLEKNGYGVLVRRNLKGRVIGKSSLSRLVQMVENESAIHKWRDEKCTEEQRWDWASPSAIFKHCPVFAKAADGNQHKKVGRELERQEARIEELEQERDEAKVLVNEAFDALTKLFEKFGATAADLDAVLGGPTELSVAYQKFVNDRDSHIRATKPKQSKAKPERVKNKPEPTGKPTKVAKSTPPSQRPSKATLPDRINTKFEANGDPRRLTFIKTPLGVIYALEGPKQDGGTQDIEGGMSYQDIVALARELGI